ncbi:uncharacterized protein LOC125680019 [Ostrea edulis]|uniref:uncharacterized protein LOC125680019 n=1 Tax=Ostrea edulis TaxID=37623 RepID=UPI0024AEC9D2|nr:uncharacterized protein LOC125680019 [Ostrea edulis]
MKVNVGIDLALMQGFVFLILPQKVDLISEAVPSVYQSLGILSTPTTSVEPPRKRHRSNAAQIRFQKAGSIRREESVVPKCAKPLLSNEQIQQFITSTVIPHGRTLARADLVSAHATSETSTILKEAAKQTVHGLGSDCYSNNSIHISGETATPFTATPYVTTDELPAGNPQNYSADHLAKPLLSNEQIQQFITFTVIPHGRTLARADSVNTHATSETSTLILEEAAKQVQGDNPGLDFHTATPEHNPLVWYRNPQQCQEIGHQTQTEINQMSNVLQPKVQNVCAAQAITANDFIQSSSANQDTHTCLPADYAQNYSADQLNLTTQNIRTVVPSVEDLLNLIKSGSSVEDVIKLIDESE